MSGPYSILFSVGTLLSLLWLALTKPSAAPGGSRSGEGTVALSRVDAGLAALAGGVVGARAAFVITHWPYYSTYPLEVLRLWQGGLSWIGGTVGTLLGLGLVSLLSRRPFWPLADSLALPAAGMSALCWLGCLLEGCAYGKPAQSSPWTSLDLYGRQIPRLPAQASGALYSLLVLALLYWLSGLSLRQGMLAGISLGLIALGALGTSFLRGDPVLLLAGLRIDTLGSAALLVAAALSLLLRREKHEAGS